MLTNTFMHIQGIGKATDARLKEYGFNSWDDVLAAKKLPLGPALSAAALPVLAESRERLEAGDALWFSERLPISEQWRLFPHFRDRAAYVDIETSGLSWPEGRITCIALYDGSSLKTYVHGHNLEDFQDDIEAYSMLVTWNGRAFDAPFIRRSFSIPLRMAHLDLFPVFRALGHKGGLKKVEKIFGLERDALDGVDGYTAVLLWNEYMRSGHPGALESLLAYNAEDVFSLEQLGYIACLEHGCPLGERPDKPDNPFKADLNLLKKLADWRLQRYSYY